MPHQSFGFQNFGKLVLPSYVDYRWFEEAFHFYLVYLMTQKQMKKQVFPNVHFTMLLPILEIHINYKIYSQTSIFLLYV